MATQVWCVLRTGLSTLVPRTRALTLRQVSQPPSAELLAAEKKEAAVAANEAKAEAKKKEADAKAAAAKAKEREKAKAAAAKAKAEAAAK